MTVGDLLAEPCYAHLNEAGLQTEIGQRLHAAGHDVEREAWIGSAERIDFLIGRTGIEVKVAGSTTQVRRQLARYAACTAVDELILVTTRVTHRALHGEVLNGVPVVVVVPSWL